jgi:imidazolonepropionase-like amidohydrolase
MTFSPFARRFIAGALTLSLIAACSQKETAPAADNAEAPASETYAVITGGARVGHLKIEPTDGAIAIDYDYKNHGRGPTFKETVSFDDAGVPVSWSIAGATTFGNQVEETFALTEGEASWTDATGDGAATVTAPSLYISQFASPYSLFIYARALLSDEDGVMPALPGGELRLTEMEKLAVGGAPGAKKVTTYALSGADLNPDYFILDDEQKFFAYIDSGFIIIREGYEDEEVRLRALAEKYSAERFAGIQAKVAHKYNRPVRIRDVRLFDPRALALGEPVSVVVSGERIERIDPADAPPLDGETVIEGNGGTLVAGIYDMHGHMGENAALLNVAAGVTSVRDMGNENEVLENLMKRIADGTLAGPRIVRGGFIEGKSPFSSNNGILVESEEQGIAAVRKYHEMGFDFIKLYNSMNGDWAPAIVAEAKRLGMPVMGHVPAFSNANAMIRAGYDEMTHINQVMLGWVLAPEEDTRTLLRLTALKRLPDLDLSGEKVQETISLMVENGVAIDPTLTIHEYLLLARNGETRAGVLDYVDHMPANFQRGAKVALSDVATPEDDAAYRGAWGQIVATVKMMHERGVFIVFGTDLGGAFNLHREFELYQDVGFTPAEILKRATYDAADYLGQADDLGSIEDGKLADFFLVPGDPTADLKAIKTISLVSRGGVFYYPSEIYPEFGITPFTEVPVVSAAE